MTDPAIRICFCIDTTREDERLRALLKRAEAYLSLQGAESCVLSPAQIHPADHPECLYLADDPAIAAAIKEAGGRVAGFLHEHNREEKFSGLGFVFDEVDEVELDSYHKAWERLAGIPWTILKTPRITVRETTLDDVDAFYAIYQDPSMTEYQEGLFSDPADEKHYMEDYIRKIYGMLGFGVWTLVRREDDTVIGRAGFSIRKGFEDVELGFMIGRPWQGQGYAFEACEAIMRYGQRVLLFDRVQALVKEGNEASLRLCDKLGFRRDGEVRIEEDIYGGSYHGEGTVSLSPSHYGRYIRFVKEYDPVRG